MVNNGTLRVPTAHAIHDPSIFTTCTPARPASINLAVDVGVKREEAVAADGHYFATDINGVDGSVVVETVDDIAGACIKRSERAAAVTT